ncbi:hypothetical protein L873DRAFT_1511132 [Choiromyces venosus 120613-1]|uniref:Uncharacterized protein n=1 Tax=Choiromyces venosus 120613-1 TaxID=1336337 RepID=A0A3N4JBG4_9PEZI|nr:hypothetical protein L873DRAFT_1511132 [Choiromyces venosus 120613-1]
MTSGQPTSMTKPTTIAQGYTAATIDDMCFIIEVQSPVPEDFNPLDLRDKLNNLLPNNCSRFTGIRRSQKGNLVCYTLGDPSNTIKCFLVWPPGIPFKPIQVNAENQWEHRILYLSQPCHSNADLYEELNHYNSSLRLASSPWLLSPKVALVFFTCITDIPEYIFTYGSRYWLASYRAKTPAQAAEARKDKLRATTDVRTETSIGDVVIGQERSGLGGWASEMQMQEELEVEDNCREIMDIREEN